MPLDEAGSISSRKRLPPASLSTIGQETAKTPLHLAAGGGRLTVVRRLLEARADADPGVRERRNGWSVEEWRAVGGLPGLRPPTSLRSAEGLERDAVAVRELMRQASSVEEYAARRGRGTMIFSYGAHDLTDGEADRWAKRLTEILRTPDLLDACEDRYLAGDEFRLDRLRREQSRLSRERWNAKRRRIDGERAET